MRYETMYSVFKHCLYFMIFYDIKMNKKKWELSYIADIKSNAYHVRMKSYSLKKNSTLCRNKFSIIHEFYEKFFNEKFRQSVNFAQSFVY